MTDAPDTPQTENPSDPTDAQAARTEAVANANREAQREADEFAEKLDNRPTADQPKDGVFPAPTAAPPAPADQGGDTDKRPDRA